LGHDGRVTTAANAKQQRILDAAYAKFSAYGFARTSMADIAQAADMSRPALYQHYANKEEIFRSMLEGVLESAVDNALAALTAEATLEAQLDGFLQRWSGDLTEGFRATEHGGDLVEAKAGHAKPVVDAANKRLHDGLAVHLNASAPKRGRELAELLIFSSLGLKADNPPMKTLRQRLTTLARSVALNATA